MQIALKHVNGTTELYRFDLRYVDQPILILTPGWRHRRDAGDWRGSSRWSEGSMTARPVNDGIYPRAARRRAFSLFSPAQPEQVVTVPLPFVAPVDASPARASTSPRHQVPDGDRVSDQDRAAAAMDAIRRVQAGDGEAFGLIFDCYHTLIFRFIFFRVRHQQLAEDITSDTFLRALRKINGFRWQGRDPGAWLFTIARNLIADHFKRAATRYEVFEESSDAGAVDSDTSSQPEDALVERYTNKELFNALTLLTPDQREVIILRVLQGISVGDTAKLIGKNPQAVKALTHRGLQALKRFLPNGMRTS
jgi:RNA polymerase sigma-70 factor (ECF subfamily)